MPAEAARSLGHQLGKVGASKRRHRELTCACPFEDVAGPIYLALDVSCLTRHADLVLDLVVIGLELLETEWPVFDGRPLRNPRCAVSLPRLADDLEVPGTE